MIRVWIRADVKETDKAFVFLSSSARIYKGDFLNSMISLPKSKVEVIESKEIISGLFEYTIDIPQWLFDKLPFDNSDWDKKLKEINKNENNERSK